MGDTYGAINVIGDWNGRLGNGGELIRIEDQFGNLVDQVDYRQGGDWPELADGDGSSNVRAGLGLGGSIVAGSITGTDIHAINDTTSTTFAPKTSTR